MNRMIVICGLVGLAAVIYARHEMAALDRKIASGDVEDGPGDWPVRYRQIGRILWALAGLCVALTAAGLVGI